MQIAVFMIVLVAVFAIKVASIVLATDDALWKSTSFSWMNPTAEDAVIPAAEMQGAVEEQRASATVPVSAFGHRHAKAA